MTIAASSSIQDFFEGFSQYGRSKEALQLFEDTKLAGVRPNMITFVGVLAACSHTGMVDEALAYFAMMNNEYGIKPIKDHYACIIDMFVRLGRLDETFDFIKRMSFEPNEFIWSNLIAGCRSHVNMELAFYAADRLLELKPKDAETYILLLNMYVSAGSWNDVSRVRKVMKDEKLGKLRDWSWINIKSRIYSFGADDRSNSQSTQIYELLDQLLDKAKSLGYASERTSEVINDEDRENESCPTTFHSENLAIAFGLINKPEGATIRVVKNISMCKDCHNCVKSFSILTDREIIVRYSKHMHRFINGHCSCVGFGALL